MNTEKNELRPIIIVIGLFVILLIFGFLTVKKSHFPYKVTEKEILNEVIDNKYCLSTNEVNEIVKSKSKKYLFIDLRSPSEFQIEHIENALNIPFEDLLSREYQEVWSNSEFSKILYATDEIEATEAWMLLRQLGYMDNLIIAGNYFKPNTDSIIAKVNFSDPAIYNYAEIIKESQKTEVKPEEPKLLAPKPSPKPVKVEERKAAGGC